jgi:hypothetical protein
VPLVEYVGLDGLGLIVGPCAAPLYVNNNGETLNVTPAGAIVQEVAPLVPV